VKESCAITVTDDDIREGILGLLGSDVPRRTEPGELEGLIRELQTVDLGPDNEELSADLRALFAAVDPVAFANQLASPGTTEEAHISNAVNIDGVIW
jgi:hypothetical protein